MPKFPNEFKIKQSLSVEQADLSRSARPPAVGQGQTGLRAER